MSDEESSQEESSQEGKTEEAPVCPIPPEHVKLFADCCQKYEKGEMTDIDVIAEVTKTLKQLKKTET